MKTTDLSIIARGTGTILRPVLQKLMARLDKLEAMAGIGPESKTLADAYKGTWQWGQAHKRGALITDRSSLWMCVSDTDTRPGDDHESWKLVAKSGRAPERQR